MSSQAAQRKNELQAKLQTVPHKPGVYLMRDRLHRVIYVGKARDLRKRMAHYFTPSREMNADIKTSALIKSIWDFDIHTLKSEAEAILFEGKLIKEYRPKYNVSFRDDKRFLLLKVNPSDPFPKFQTVRLRKEDGSRYFGPFAHSGALRTSLNWILKNYGLRSCHPKIPGERDYAHCHNDLIKNCSAPCIGKVTQEQYLERVEQACHFLEGHSREMIGALEKQMEQAAADLQFEKAAQLRDMVQDLKTTLKPSRRFTRANLPSAQNPEEDLELLADALNLQAPPKVLECFDISNISNTHIVASMVCFKNGLPDKSSYRRYRIKTVDSQDDFASIEEVVRRRYSRVLLQARAEIGEDAANSTQENPAEAIARLSLETGVRSRLPDLIIVDGGKGQLSAACKALQDLGLNELPIVGLAKQFEEIYRPGYPTPLRLPSDSGSLFLLQRIRDEAHRFANTYHQLLMKKRMDESILDECPGISKNKKHLLLQTFGSVAKLKKASVEQIAGIHGISAKLADKIVGYLNGAAKS